MEEPDFDLYDDLDEALIQPLSKDIAKQKAQEEEKLSKEKELREELDKLSEENKELKSALELVKTNFSSFSITARKEVER